MLLSTDLYQIKQIRELEKLAIKKLHINEAELMQRAGLAALNAIVEFYEEIDELTVVCGKGNNAGDGYVLARFAHESQIPVKVFYIADIQHLSGVAKEAALAAKQAGVPMEAFTSDTTLTGDLIVDAILGIGIHEVAYGLALAAIQAINAAESEVVSIDVPSGIDADSGRVLGAAVRATLTVTFLGMKQGLVTGDALNYAGEVVVDDLGVDATLFESIPISGIQLSLPDLENWLEPRDRNSHKGDFGHVLIVGGDDGMPGAVCMAGLGALRVGAGLVTVATRPEHVAIVCAAAPELMCYGISKQSDLKPLLEKASVIVIGPGLGTSKWSQDLYKQIVKSKLPMVVDGSAFHFLAQDPQANKNWVITPHPGEAAHLLRESTDEIQLNRFHAVVRLHQQFKGVVVLKGAGTIIQEEDNVPFVCDAGNPGMSTAGMGDILSGVIGGLLAQGLSLNDAACAGVVLHACAGDLAAQEGERGIIATDLLPYIKHLANPPFELQLDDYYGDLEDSDLLDEINSANDPDNFEK